MKICILTHTFPRYQGDYVAPFMFGLSEGIAQTGNKVFVLTPFTSGLKTNRKTNFKIITYKYFFPKFMHKLGYSQTLNNDLSLTPVVYLLAPFMYLFGTISLIKLIKREQIDVISAHWILPNGFIGGVAGLITGTPVITTLPGSDILMARKNFFFKFLAILSAKWAYTVTSNSGGLINDLGKVGAKIEKKQIILYGVDPKEFRPNKNNTLNLKKALGISYKNVVVVGVGRLVEKKGFRYLIKAIPSIISKHKNVTFVIVGDGAEKNMLEDLVKRMKVEEHVKIIGMIDYKTLIDYYNMADIFVLPSTHDREGNLDDQSVAVVEAMACGKPVITSNLPGYGVIIKQGVNGLLVPEQDEKEIASCINKLIEDPSLRIQIGKKARESINKKFSWQVIGREYVRLFKDAVNEYKGDIYYSKVVPKIFDKKSRQRVAQQIIGTLKVYLGDTKKLTCLDVGCSDGSITSALSINFKKVLGIDIDSDAIKIAREKYKKKNLKFEVMSGEKMGIKSNSFDVVVLNQVYEFSPNPEKLVGEVYRVLKKGGICLVGARNKISFIEGQSGIPLLHYLPKALGQKIATTLKIQYYPPNYLTLSGLEKLFSSFSIDNITIDILKDPQKFEFESLLKYQPVLRLVPRRVLNLLVDFAPNYILVCRKD